MKKNKNDNSVVGEVVEDLADIGIGKLIEETKSFMPVLDGIATHVPWIKTAIAAIKFPRSVGDFFLGKKVSSFLYASNLSEEKVAKLKKKFTSVQQDRLWERVMLSINAHDDKMKSEIIGKLISALIDDEITYDQFFDMVHATNNLNLNMLDQLKELYMLAYSLELAGSIYYSFATVGLIGIDNSTVGVMDGSGPKYPLNQLGWKYVGVVYEYPESSIKDTKVGIGSLVNELDDNFMISGKSFPLSVIKDKGMRYQEVDLFIVNSRQEILCNIESLHPVVMGTATVLSDEKPIDRVVHLANELGIASSKSQEFLARNMRNDRVQKHAFFLSSDATVPNTVFKTIGEARAAIELIEEKTDYMRYILEAAEQLDRPVNKLGM